MVLAWPQAPSQTLIQRTDPLKATGRAARAASPAGAAGTDVTNSIAGCATLDALSSAGLPIPAVVMTGGAGGGAAGAALGLLPVPGRTEEKAVVPPLLAHTLHGGKEEGVEMAPSAHAPEEQEKKIASEPWAKPAVQCRGMGASSFYP